MYDFVPIQVSSSFQTFSSARQTWRSGERSTRAGESDQRERARACLWSSVKRGPIPAVLLSLASDSRRSNSMIYSLCPMSMIGLVYLPVRSSNVGRISAGSSGSVACKQGSRPPLCFPPPPPSFLPLNANNPPSWTHLRLAGPDALSHLPHARSPHRPGHLSFPAHRLKEASRSTRPPRLSSRTPRRRAPPPLPAL